MPGEKTSDEDSAFKQAVHECERSIVSESDRELMTGTTTVTFWERDMNRCLGARGWKQTPHGEHAYRFDAWMREAAVVK
jgi:hypothetical protein